MLVIMIQILGIITNKKIKYIVANGVYMIIIELYVYTSNSEFYDDNYQVIIS